MTPAAAHCVVHAGRLAGWRCAGCQRTLCPGCVVEVSLPPTSYVRCGRCDGAVYVLTRPGADLAFGPALRGALLLPVGLPGVLILLGLSVVASQLDALQPPVRAATLLVWSAVAWLAGAALVRASAEGAQTLRGIQLSLWPELVRPALVATLLTAPALWVPRTGLLGALLVAAATPLLVPTLLEVLCLAPLREALSPLEAVRKALRLGKDGVLAVVCVGLVWLFARMLGGLAEFPPTEVPPLWLKTADGLAALSLFLVPRLLGLLVASRGEDLDYPFKTRGEVPVLPGARPETTVAHRPPEPPPRARIGPIALEETAGVLDLEPLAPTGRREN